VQIYGQGVRYLPWQAVAVAMIVLWLLLLGFAFSTGRRSGWTPTHTFAFAAGATLTYCWTGLFSELALHGPSMLWAHAILAAAMAAFLMLAAFRVRSGR
jgi:hypothetical protein